jgi:hypothetical protein
MGTGSCYGRGRRHREKGRKQVQRNCKSVQRTGSQATEPAPRIPLKPGAKPDELSGPSPAAAVIPRPGEIVSFILLALSIHNNRRYRDERAWRCTLLQQALACTLPRVARKFCPHLCCFFLIWHKTCSSDTSTLSHAHQRDPCAHSHQETGQRVGSGRRGSVGRGCGVAMETPGHTSQASGRSAGRKP